MQEQTQQPGAVIESTIAHTSDITAEVNAPPSQEQVRLYKPDGRSTLAQPDEVEAWLAEGWTREKRDVPTLSSAIGPLCDAAKVAVQTYVSQAQAEGSLSKAVQAQARAAHMAMTELVVCWHHLDRALQDRYQVEEDEPATIEHPVLGTVRVDPGQRDDYAAAFAAWDAYRVAHPELPESREFDARLVPLYKTALPAQMEVRS